MPDGTTVFRAGTLEGAVAMATDELGPGTQIQAARRVRQGLRGLMGQEYVEVVAVPAPAGEAVSADSPAGAEPAQASAEPDATSGVEDTLARMLADVERLEEGFDGPGAAPTPPAPAPVTPPGSSDFSAMVEEALERLPPAPEPPTDLFTAATDDPAAPDSPPAPTPPTAAPPASAPQTSAPQTSETTVDDTQTPPATPGDDVGGADASLTPAAEPTDAPATATPPEIPADDTGIADLATLAELEDESGAAGESAMTEALDLRPARPARRAAAPARRRAAAPEAAEPEAEADSLEAPASRPARRAAAKRAAARRAPAGRTAAAGRTGGRRGAATEEEPTPRRRGAAATGGASGRRGGRNATISGPAAQDAPLGDGDGTVAEAPASPRARAVAAAPAGAARALRRAAAPRTTPAPTPAIRANDTEENDMDGIDEPLWSREALSALGVPEQILEALPEREPRGDLAWVTALAKAIQSLVPGPVQVGPETPVAVDGYGPQGALVILQAGVGGLPPGRLASLDGRVAPATPLELALAVRTCVAS
jgi:hypothetical protein